MKPKLSDPSSPQSSGLIDIIPLGRVDPLSVSIVAANLQTIIGINANVLEPIPSPEYAFLSNRQQFDALKIIKQISKEHQGAKFKLGVTEFDICTPILTFVYGESQLGGRVALISMNRLHGDGAESTYERVAKIGVHEIGHLLGLEHCWEVRCLMHFSRNLDQLDSLPLQFCSACGFETVRRIKNIKAG